MGTIIFIEHNGSKHEVNIEEGQTLMQTAVDNEVPGIDGDCGGSCACGTCHVIVAPQWASSTGKVKGDEKQMLELTPENTTSSRLSCQIYTTEAMDGMIVRLPEFQM